MSTATDLAISSLKWIKNTCNSMRSNQSITKIEDNIKNAQTGGSLLHSIFGESTYLTAEAAARQGGKVDHIVDNMAGQRKWYHFTTDVTNEAGEVIGKNTWNGAGIGAGVGAGAIGARFASGGGIYRDANGNTDIVGVPFV